MSGFQGMSFAECLSDLQSRFLINVPVDELASVERICFQIEQAHWFYEDFVRERSPHLASLSLKNFSAHFFRQCPLLVNWASDHEAAFATFMQYKVRVPVCGAILLNEPMDKVLLVRGWKSKSGWAFPRGKINKEEPEHECAIREVYEETGFDMRSRLVASEFVERTMKEQRIRLYVVRGVSESTQFLTQTRKEIGDIRWFPLRDLPGYKNMTATNDPHAGVASSAGNQKFYMVTAFVGSLKKWIHKFKRTNTTKKSGGTRVGGVPGSKNAGSALLGVHQNAGGYKSATEYESENDAGVLSDSQGNLVNQDQEDWGVGTLHQATDLIKSLIGIGESSSSLATGSVATSSLEGELSETSSTVVGQQIPPGVHQFAPRQQQYLVQQAHQQYSAPQQQLQFSVQQQPNSHTGYQQQQPYAQQQQMQHPNQQQFQYQTQQSQESLIAQFQAARHNSLPLQGIITTPDGATTPAMIQILPLNGPTAGVFSPATATPFDARTTSPVSFTVPTDAQRENLLALLKGDSSAGPGKKAISLHQDLKTVPPPPPVTRREPELMSDEIKSSYGGGGGGPTAKFGGIRLPPATTGGGDLQSAKDALLNILTKGADAAATPMQHSSGRLSSPTQQGYTAKTPLQSDFRAASPSQESGFYQRRPSRPLSALPPPPPPEAVPLANPLASMLVTASNGAAGLPPKMPKEVGQDVEVLSTKRVSQPPYGGSAGGKAVGRKQKGVTSPVPPSVSAPRNVAESLKDPWINLPRQEQQQQPHQIPGSVVQNTVPQRRPSQPEAYSRPMSQQSQHPLPQQPQHHQSSPQQQFYQPPSSHQFQSQQQQYQNPAIMNLPSGQNLLDLLRGGPSSASTAAPIPHSSKPETPAPIAQTQHTQIAGAQSPLQSLSGQPSLMDILKGVAGSSSGGGGGGGGPLQGGFGGVISGNGGMGGGGGGGLGAGFFSAAMSKNSVTTVGTHDSSANADALRSILGIGKKPQ